jgi:hypothetical protein
MSENPPILPKKERLQLAVAHKARSPMRSTRQLAIIYGVPPSTLCHQLNGRRTQTEYMQSLQRLTVEEENSIKHWIEKLISWNWNPKIEQLERYATHLLRLRNDFEPLGIKWYTQFLDRHPDFKLRYSRALNQDRVDATDYGIMQRWFNLYHETCQKYGIVDDIYNMDEKGIALGLIESGKIICHRKDLNHYTIQPGTRE